MRQRRLGAGASDLVASQHERCHGGASGHETDKRSANSPADTILLAKGENPDDGGAEMVIHSPDAAKGSAVFSVGSINWFGSLSHNAYDNSVSRVTENVIRLFASTPRGEAPIR